MRSRFLWAILAALLVFAALAPTLSIAEFSRTLENLNVETALEARRDGHWMVPSLEGLPRTKKPPLTAWITGAAIRPQTLADCSSRDAAVRSAAYHKLGWEVRWPALVQCCLAIIAVYFLGQCLNVGAESAFFLASTYLFLRYAQLSTTDVPLTLWVISSNALFATAVFTQRRWLGIFAGAALGVAFLSKGPVCLGQTLAAWVVWWLWDNRARIRWRYVIAAAIACVVISVPWYLTVLLKDPEGQWHTWFREVTGSDAPARRTPFYQYLLFLPEFLPALLFVFFVRARDSRERSALRMMVCMIVVPLLIQSFFKDKTDRYILPLTGPMAVLAAVGLRNLLPSRRRADVAIYWFILAAALVTFAICGALGWPNALRGVTGRPWFDWKLALAAILVAILIFLAANYMQKQPIASALFTSLYVLLFMHLLALGYYGQSPTARSKMLPLADLIWQKYPNAEMFTSEPVGHRASEDLSIYLNRLTGWITLDEMARVTSGSRPKVVVMKETGQPTPVPFGWHDFIAMPKEEGETWRLVVLPSK